MTFDKFCVLSYVSFRFLSGLMSSDSLSMLTERRGIVSLGFTFEISCEFEHKKHYFGLGDLSCY